MYILVERVYTVQCTSYHVYIQARCLFASVWSHSNHLGAQIDQIGRVVSDMKLSGPNSAPMSIRCLSGSHSADHGGNKSIATSQRTL